MILSIEFDRILHRPFIFLFLFLSFALLTSCKQESSNLKNSELSSIEEVNNGKDNSNISINIDQHNVEEEEIVNTGEKGSILSNMSFKFTDQLIFKYKTNLSGYGNYYNGEGDQVGEIVIYVEPKSNTFLFSKEAYGLSGEMVDFVIADTLGNYIFGYTDEFGKKYRENYFIEYVKLDAERRKLLENDFRKYLRLKKETKVFGKKSFPTPTYVAQAYDMTYRTTIDTSRIFLAPSFINMRPIYSFNGLDLETKLPYYFDFNNVIPNRFMPVYNKYKASEDIGFSEMYLDSYQPTEYYVDLSKYKSIARN